ISARSRANKGVLAHLLAQAGVRAMAGDHGGLLVEDVQTLPDRTLDGGVVAAPQVGTADATTEQRVTCYQQLGVCEPETHGARRVPWRMQGHTATAGQLLIVC